MPIFYHADDHKFVVTAGKISWSGRLETEKEVNQFEGWLKNHGAKEVKGWRELSEIFA